MGIDPKKPPHGEEELDDEGSTAMFSREAHGWFSSMADAQETDPNSVADLGRNAVIESSPLSRTGGAPPVNLTRTGSMPAALGRTGSLPAPRPSAGPGAPGSQPAPALAAAPSLVAQKGSGPLASLGAKQVVALAFVGGALVAAALGAIAFFLLTAR